jgi:multidrug transporter EmrE-like cation transporter
MPTFSIVTEAARAPSAMSSARPSAGFSKPVITALRIVIYGVSFCRFAMAVERIKVILAYAIRAGLGTALIIIMCSREGVDTIRIAATAAIIVPGLADAIEST